MAKATYDKLLEEYGYDQTNSDKGSYSGATVINQIDTKANKSLSSAEIFIIFSLVSTTLVFALLILILRRLPIKNKKNTK